MLKEKCSFKCVSCNRPFVGHKEGQIYCSRKCNIDSQRNKFKFSSRKKGLGAYGSLSNELREVVDEQGLNYEETT